MASEGPPRSPHRRLDERMKIALTPSAGERNRTGFTVLELLVVVGIVVLLGALLFPALQSAAKRARSAGCLSSLKQLYIGATQFAAENNGTIPCTVLDVSSGDYDFWSYRVSEYALGNPGSVMCPDSPFARGKRVSSSREAMANYGMNERLHFLQNSATGEAVGNFAPPGWWPRGLRPPRFTDLGAPSSTILYFDSGAYMMSQSRATSPSAAWWYVPGYRSNKNVSSFYTGDRRVTVDAQQGRHGGVICYVRADGSLGQSSADDFVDNSETWTVPFSR